MDAKNFGAQKIMQKIITRRQEKGLGGGGGIKAKKEHIMESCVCVWGGGGGKQEGDMYENFTALDFALQHAPSPRSHTHSERQVYSCSPLLKGGNLQGYQFSLMHFFFLFFSNFFLWRQSSSESDQKRFLL